MNKAMRVRTPKLCTMHCKKSNVGQLTAATDVGGSVVPALRQFAGLRRARVGEARGPIRKLPSPPAKRLGLGFRI